MNFHLICQRATRSLPRNLIGSFHSALFASLMFVTASNATETVTVVEFYNRDLDSYFITGRTNEQQLLDTVPSFIRTGAAFVARPASSPAAGQTRICRYYISTSSPSASSHFYGRENSDCVAIANTAPAGFTYEGFDFAIATPSATGQCDAAARFPVYRAFRSAANGKTPNHRYLTSLSQYNAMIARGWVGEGVAFCATSVIDVSSVAERAARVRVAAENDSQCREIMPYHYQIGDRNGALTSGNIGNDYSADTVAPIASATKWLYGAYVTEIRRGQLTSDDFRFLTFRSGYVGFLGCERGETVSACASRAQNAQFSAAAVDKFFYGGGHMQQHAAQFAGLGSLTPEPLGRELDRALGLGTTTAQFTLLQPQLAGGVYTSANVYASFLRKLLREELFASTQHESYAVCTNPSTCSDAIATPFPSNESPRYGIGHWIEDTAVSDGAYSSAGAFGFYPWIDASKQYYGVIARFDTDGRAGMGSVACGRVLRNAWNVSN